MFPIICSVVRRGGLFVGTLACSSLLVASGLLVGQERVSPSINVEQTAQGFTAHVGSESLHVTVCGDDVIHVVAGPGDASASSPVQPWMLDADKSCPGAGFHFAQDGTSASLTAAALKVEFSLKNGNLTYRDLQGKSLLREGDREPRTYEKAEVNGETTLPCDRPFFA